MDLNIVGRNAGITDRFRDYATEKADKVANLADKALALEVKVCRHHETNGTSGNDRVELTLIGKGPVVRAEADGADKYAAFDVAFGKLMERVRRAKDRRKVHRGGGHRHASVRDDAEGAFTGAGIQPASAQVLEQVRTGSIPVVTGTQSAVQEEVENDDYSPVVIRRKSFSSSPMTIDDALYNMELVGHDFYLYFDVETGRPSVVYRRKGWDYGVIGLEAEAETVPA
ncbi:ribosome-associated translation inhibitor RaiA [Glaciibacter flavus]|uniref:Ribosome hibernation promoting factor n=1 Tax=Orlajensenia flava TaxID=2565934 RepID=A0A4S4FYJ4_9MICO|nr:ribosome-associated translation inhibitor RaiA [Glaciibacter flavus]THG35694.1 ribosome-associated translation inhibitor RaiA [Glaciibacter flavus]